MGVVLEEDARRGRIAVGGFVEGSVAEKRHKVCRLGLPSIFLKDRAPILRLPSWRNAALDAATLPHNLSAQHRLAWHGSV